MKRESKLKRISKSLIRSAAVGAVALGTMVTLSTSAYAADHSVTLNGRGFMEFVDSGDKFRVCDTNIDGHGVVGKLKKYSTDATVFTITDGGDADCSAYKTYDITGSTRYYLHLCWNPPSGPCISGSNFSES